MTITCLLELMLKKKAIVTPWLQDLQSYDLAYDLVCDLTHDLIFDLVYDLICDLPNLIFLEANKPYLYYY